ncbi:DUF4326 domain-containing protein [Nocardiopsis gilva YIM 90087]|uniref:DUF4326 domain-containing protein n=1 Tax=Nocardiopsis gilva YIM 90087 TaxID=1235441 RepID=A0A223SAI3_9ACTN|nr:DUF4326 domain-containing protein [Nocardiopsis gilva]ASU85138.1 DUF4326 domain-containing protein [Nocardiopsis gilva YIM 90087]
MNDQPRRVRVTWRVPGGKKPASVKYVGRPTRWGNPHLLDEPCDAPQCGGAVHDRPESLRLFREHLRAHPDLVAAARRELAGWDLACYCPLDVDCHADIWLGVVNGGEQP